MFEFNPKYVMNIIFNHLWFHQTIEIKLYSDEYIPRL